MGCISAAGCGIEELAATLEGRRSVVPSFPEKRLNCVYASCYPVFQVSESLLSERQSDETLSFFFLRKALEEALQQARITSDMLRTLRVGVCVGTSVDASFNLFEFYRDWRNGEPVNQDVFAHHQSASLSDKVLRYYGITGLSQTVVTACASGTDAIGIGAEWIENDFCDLVIAGGADELSWVPYIGFIRLMIAGQTACRPFSKDRAGITLGEGAGVFILESRELIKRRAVKPQGFVIGYGNACDGYHATAPEPQGRGMQKAIQTALRQASLASTDLAFVNAHGTGTLDNDAAEAFVFHNLLPQVPVCATKSYTGHTLGAAGAIEAVITLLSLNRGRIPGANFSDPIPDPSLAISPVWEAQLIPANRRAALSDSLAFGGCNAALVVEKEETDDC